MFFLFDFIVGVFFCSFVCFWGFFVWQEDGICVRSVPLVPVKIDPNLAKSGGFKKESHFSCSGEMC